MSNEDHIVQLNSITQEQSKQTLILRSEIAEKTSSINHLIREKNKITKNMK